VIINKQGTFRPFSTAICVYPPPPFLAIHHWSLGKSHLRRVLVKDGASSVTEGMICFGKLSRKYHEYHAAKSNLYMNVQI